MTPAEPSRKPRRPPRLAVTLLRLLLPAAVREEVARDVADEYRARAESDGPIAARRWLWRQVIGSVPSLLGMGIRRGWSGFAPRSESMRPGGVMFQGWAMDLKYALRRLRARRTYTALTVLTLALGVAGTAAVYSIAERLLFDPLPYADEEQIVAFWAQQSWSEAEFASMRPDMQDFASVAAVRPADVSLVRGGSAARLVSGVSATAELFDVLGAAPVLGTGFRPGDDALGAAPVAVLGHSLWQELGGDPAIVGQTVELSGVARTVVGVMPEGFWYPDPSVRVWLAEAVDPENGSGNYSLVGRMPAGVDVQGMQGPLARLTGLLGERFEYPEAWDKTVDAELTPLRDVLLGSVRPALVALLAAMVVILLIACVNVAALMLGEMDGRRAELAVRSALGAGRERLLRQVVSESVILGLLSGVAGALLALAGFRFLVGALPLGALAENASVDWTLFAAAIAVALVAATTVALAPGATLARGDLQRRLATVRTAGASARGGRVESALVVVQVALVLLLGSGSALLIRSVAELRAIDPGLEAEGVAVADVLIPDAGMPDLPRTMGELTTALAALPGVEEAAATQRLPLRGSSDNWGIAVEGRPELGSTTTAFRVVSPDYFTAMGIPVLEGRGLLESDRTEAAEGAVVINRALAEQYFPGVDPVGRRIAFTDRWDRIVGVVGNVAEAGLTDGAVPARYMVHEQALFLLPWQSIVIRTAGGGDPAALLESLRRTIETTAPGVAIRELTTMESVLDRAIGPVKQVMALLSLLGALALVLGTIGVYGAVSHFVARRQREWGIRIALGLRPAGVLGTIVGRGGALVGGGAVLGLIAFLAVARGLSSFLYGVGTADPLSLIGSTSVLLAAGLVAALVPARRASRTDPATVLREQ